MLSSVLLAWVLTNSLLAASITSTNASGAGAGANAAVSGYMTFLLYSVALLACELAFLLFRRFFCKLRLCSCEILWVDVVLDYSDVCRGIETLDIVYES